MLCELCKQNQATVHVEEIIGGKKLTLNICTECAAKKDLLAQFMHGLDLNGLLKNMYKHFVQDEDGDDEEMEADSSSRRDDVPQSCPFCNWTVEKLRKTGRLGCSRCYHVFRDILNDSLIAMHRGLHHKGKSPDHPESPGTIAKDMELIRELESLRRDLQGSIRREEYEIAARIRDKISDLEQLLAEKGIPI